MTASTGRSARVQAATVRVRDAFVAQRFGAPAHRVYREKATPALRDFLANPKDPPGGWVPFELFVEANVLADRLYGKGDLALAFNIGRFAASHNVGMWKSLLMRTVSPSVLLAITSGLWSHHYEGGRLASRPNGATGFTVNILDFPTPHRAHCLSIAGWIQGSLELGPRKNVTVHESSCRAQGEAVCEFRVAWK